MYSIFYYNMINIRVLIILKYFGDLDFECYIYMCVCVCARACRVRDVFFFLFKEMENCA
jgi:hypothetical protein